MYPATLIRCAREAEAWLMDACFPLWSDAGFDGQAFRECLTVEHQARNEPTTRVRVQARQTYIFAKAVHMGWQPQRAQALVRAGVEILAGPARRRDGLIGRTLDSETLALADDTADLYDTAFALMALAEAATVMDDPAPTLAVASDILARLDELMKDEAAGGYAEALPPPDLRAQNPHMHLFEACLALHEADPSGDHLERAGILRALFQDRFMAGASGLLAERFGPGWSPLEDDGPFEPGHHFEWAWLLARHARLTSTSPPPEAGRLYDFAVMACSKNGHIPQSCDASGHPVDASRRTWPQTEALKAYLCMTEKRSETMGYGPRCPEF